MFHVKHRPPVPGESEVIMNNIIDRINHDNITRALRRETITLFLQGDWTNKIDIICTEYNCTRDNIHICVYYTNSHETFINIVKG